VAGRSNNREEWTKLLRTARNRPILHMAVKRMNTIKIFFSKLQEERLNHTWVYTVISRHT
jgi:hypothetical protein